MPFSPKFSITNTIASYLIEIERARGFLQAARLSEQWITKMQERALVLEAHSTTHIEGTQLSLDQSQEILMGKEVKSVLEDDKRELLNYVKAFDFVAEYVQTDGPITEGLIREIHKLLVGGVRGNEAAPGQYRNIQNYVANSKTREIIYTPPPAHDVPRLMEELVQWLQSTNIPPILASGIAQFQFVEIHPFVDGNGRTSRLLSTLYLYKTGYDFKRLFTISEYYDRDRTEYYLALRTVYKNAGDMTLWLEYFTHGLATQMKEIQTKGEKTIKLDVIALEKKLTSRQRDILGFGLETRRFSLQELKNHMPNISTRTLQRDLLKLTQANLVEVNKWGPQTTYTISL